MGLTATHKNSGWPHGSRLRGHPEFRSYPLVVFRLQCDEAVVESVAAVHHGRLRVLLVDEEVEVVAHQLHLAERFEIGRATCRERRAFLWGEVRWEQEERRGSVVNRK